MTCALRLRGPSVFVLLAAALSQAPAAAQDPVIELRRSSRHTLPVGTAEVELVRQTEGACRFGRSWGYDLASRELWTGDCGGSFRIVARGAEARPAESSNTGAALAAAAAIAGIAILASRGRHDKDNDSDYYPPENRPGYSPPQSGYYPPNPGRYPDEGGRRGAIHGPGGLCLDIAGGVSQGSALIVYSCNGQGNQRFEWTPRGELKVGGMCLDMQGGGNANGTRVLAWGCNGGRNQQWYVDGSSIRSRQNGKCLDVEGGNIRPGTRVIMFDCHGARNQRWFW